MTKQPLFQRPAKRRQIAENGRGIAPTLLEFEKADDEPGPSESSGQEGQKMRVPRRWRDKLRLPAPACGRQAPLPDERFWQVGQDGFIAATTSKQK